VNTEDKATHQETLHSTVPFPLIRTLVYKNWSTNNVTNYINTNTQTG